MWSDTFWGGEYWYNGYWPSEGNTIDPCPPFRLFKRDCEMEIKGWGESGAYMRVSPFGGPHHNEPSGAEI